MTNQKTEPERQTATDVNASPNPLHPLVRSSGRIEVRGFRQALKTIGPAPSLLVWSGDEVFDSRDKLFNRLRNE